MSDDTVQEQATEHAENVTEAAEGAAETEEQLPEWARKKLDKANKEAARYRTKAKEAADDASERTRQELSTHYEKKLSAVAEEKAALSAELETAQLERSKLKAALAVGIPGESAADFAELLQGATDDEIREHAEKVKDLMSAQSSSRPRAVDPSQGLGAQNSISPDQAFGSFVLGQLNK